jgi:ATP-dependent DNA helicase RecQ
LSDSHDLNAALRRYWGYDSFRPVQERVVRGLLAGRDVAVIMPTGGGKSLCYQLPALLLGKTAVVISPLIALMQDQAVQLAQMGIPAAVLNSTMPYPDQQAVIQKARRGEFRLLYTSPERLAREDTYTWLSRVPVSFFAIDEAHCISEWGHEFRPEYRLLGRLREKFPENPIAAFTASATRRVRHDILAQLKLRDPEKCILSFHRPNLRYLVRQCKNDEQDTLLLAALRAHRGSSVIVYAPTIARVIAMAGYLTSLGFPAVAYHGKMKSDERKRNQEMWMLDEVRVLVGTIAFGLGINKPSVRAVIHLSLPKSVEQYYQEAGRAGRDGLPADCLLLWQPRDLGLLVYFINQLEDEAEKSRCWQRYREIKKFAESAECRSQQICRHFGETPKWQTCGHCDVCGAEPEWMQTAEPEHGELVVPGLSQPAEMDGPDLEMMNHFRKWRRELARERQVPAYIIMNDTTLADLCRKQPRSFRELLSVFGIGERKAELYGEQILEVIRKFLH